MSWFTGLRDAVEGIATVVGNYYVPGSSLVTKGLTSKGSQQMLNSPIGQIANMASGASGASAGNLANYGNYLNQLGGNASAVGNYLPSGMANTLGMGPSTAGGISGLPADLMPNMAERGLVDSVLPAANTSVVPGLPGSIPASTGAAVSGANPLGLNFAGAQAPASVVSDAVPAAEQGYFGGLKSTGSAGALPGTGAAANVDPGMLNDASKPWWSKLTNVDTYIDPKTGKMLMPGYAALGIGSMGLNMMSANNANKFAAEREKYNNPYLQSSYYQQAIANARNPANQPWRKTMAMGGLASVYPNRQPEREVVMAPTDGYGTEPNVDPFTGQQQMAGGGVAGQPRYLQGQGDGMSDSIPAHIDGKQPAALATSEFVVPADVVSHLGNGSSEAGAQQLHAMMDRIRKARTGNVEQGKQVNARKFMPA